ncbi:cell cycle control protein 50C-like isoform X1 [Notamacropus eugenii]|uniref:cell cycle control protein 50C-like isoform X1 n=1 Tax=Notamacropus eugenii TaxID=9315 RepID=UPI003B6846DB
MKMKNNSQGLPSRMPDNTAFRQQRLPAWSPYLTAWAVLPGFFTTGAFFLSMGILLILSAKSVKEIEITYTDICSDCSKLRENASNFYKECTCSVPFFIPEKMPGDVYMYYKLHGFYQNHHRYIHSRNNRQLLGEDITNVENCAPFQRASNEIPIAPCGAIANSMFNDTILLSYYPNSTTRINVPLLSSEITWWTDKHVKFQNPESRNLSSAFAGTAKPLYWTKPVYQLDQENPENNGFLNNDFIVWMRVAALPTFKNLYRRIHRIGHFADGLPAGDYSFDISYNFPVTIFKGKKGVVLSTVTWSGGKSFFLGGAYTVTGAMTWLAAFSMTAIHLKLKKTISFQSLKLAKVKAKVERDKRRDVFRTSNTWVRTTGRDCRD